MPRPPGGARQVAGTLWCLLLLFALGGCAGLVPQTMGLRTGWPEGVARQADIAEVPFFPQQDYQCGPAALATLLVEGGTKVTPDELTPQVYLPARKGSLQVEMLAATRRYGRVSYPIAPSVHDLLREVDAGHPVLVLQDIGAGLLPQWHYAVVVGYDYPAGELYLRSGTTRRLALPFTIFEFTWKKSGYWAMVVPAAGAMPATASETPYAGAIAAMARVGPPPAARQAWLGFLQRWPDNLAATVGLANAHHALGELALAEAVLRRGAQRHPDSVVLLNNLAQTLSDMGRHHEALEVIERAVAIPSQAFGQAARETYDTILTRLAVVSP